MTSAPFELTFHVEFECSNMSPTTRKRKLVNYVPHVIEAVKILQGKDHGASTQNIVKYLEGKLNDKTNGAAVKSAIRTALNSGLLVHCSGVGLNGSFILPQKSKRITARNSGDKKQSAITKEAKLRNISSLASELQERVPLQNKPPNTENSSKRRRNTKLLVPLGNLDFDKEDQADVNVMSTPLKTILKPPGKRKFTSKFKRKNASRRVKFCSPAKVIFISPCVKRRSKRKRESNVNA